MDLMKVRNVFRGLTNITVYESDIYEPLLQIALDKIFNMLKPGIAFVSTNTALVYAIAAEAYYQYMVTQIAKETNGSVKAGVLSVTSDSDKNLARAQKIRNELLLAARDYIELDRCFYFGKTQTVNKSETEGTQ
ncbi:MAG: hypothetical protein FWG69_04105 [Oscillospiraceae bacterium]|nr:hypothetical protein [Oscillospiraceae bacterium]